MASDSANVLAATPKATGALLRAPLGTALPTSAWTAANVAFVDQGYIGEDGFTQSSSRDVEKKKAFGGTVVKVLQTDYSETVQFTFLESRNAEVLKSVHGEDNVTISVDGEIEVKKNKLRPAPASWIIDVVDETSLIRTVIPKGQIVSTDDVQKVHSDLIMYTVTMECFEDEDGNNAYEYITDELEAPGP